MSWWSCSVSAAIDLMAHDVWFSSDWAAAIVSDELLRSQVLCEFLSAMLADASYLPRSIFYCKEDMSMTFYFLQLTE